MTTAKEPHAAIGPRVDSPAGIGYVRAMVNTAPRLGSRGMGGYGPLTDIWRDTIEKLLLELEARLEVEHGGE